MSDFETNPVGTLARMKRLEDVLGKCDRAIKHGLENLKSGSNSRGSYGPKSAQSGYVYAEAPDWHLRQLQDAIRAALSEGE